MHPHMHYSSSAAFDCTVSIALHYLETQHAHHTHLHYFSNAAFYRIIAFRRIAFSETQNVTIPFCIRITFPALLSTALLLFAALQPRRHRTPPYTSTLLFQRRFPSHYRFQPHFDLGDTARHVTIPSCTCICSFQRCFRPHHCFSIALHFLGETERPCINAQITRSAFCFCFLALLSATLFLNAWFWMVCWLLVFRSIPLK